jgi:hypothetical protein
MRLQANAVICRIDQAIGDLHIATVRNIDSIIVPIRITIRVHTVNDNILTFIVRLHPACCVFQRHISDLDIPAIHKLNELGP